MVVSISLSGADAVSTESAAKESATIAVLSLLMVVSAAKVCLPSSSLLEFIFFSGF